MLLVTRQHAGGIKKPAQQADVIRDQADLYAEKDPKKAPEDMDAEVTDDDIAALGNPDEDNDMNEDETTEEAVLDDTDEEGDPLNEGETLADGSELDLPVLEDEDEENDYYSTKDDPDKDPLP